MEPLLEVNDLEVSFFSGRQQSRRTDGVSFSVQPGEFIGVIGHTGSGKSTLMQHLNGLLKPTSGNVFLDGKDIWSDKAMTRQSRFRVGLVFQYPEYQLFEETVYKDIAFGPGNMGLSQSEIDRRVRESAEIVGITPQQLQASPFDLSGGQKRRAAIAGVIAMEPEVLILAEPTAGLDPEGKEEILANIDTYRKAKNATIMMVSHSMNDVAKMADRLLVLNGGRLAMDDAPLKVFHRAQELLNIGLDIPEVTRLFLRLQELGLPVNQVYTTQQAVAELCRLKGGNVHA